MLVSKALHFAAEKHKNQKRRGTGLPYIVHPVMVMYLISKYKPQSKNLENLQCAALLHDTLEDTECSYLELEREFNPMVASLVMELTSDDEQIKRVGKNEYLKHKMLGMSKYAFILKLVDRFANISDEPKEKYVANTIELIEYLFKNREDITKTQSDLMTAILTECNGLLGIGEQTC